MAVDNYNLRKNAISRWNEFINTESVLPPKKSRKIKFDERALFFSAISAGDIEEVSKVLHENKMKSSLLNHVNSDGLTALHLACIDENFEMVKLLIHQGCNVNISDVDGWTPLHAASGAHSLPIIKELINSGASLISLNNDCNLPIDLVENEEIRTFLNLEYKNQKIDIEKVKKEEEQNMLKDVNEWITTGIIQDGPHSQGETSLHIAASKGYISVLKLLLQAGLDINGTDADGWTALHAASHWNKFEIAKFLIEDSASTSILTKKGLNFIDVAHENIRDELENFIQSFLMKQAFTNGKSIKKHSALTPNNEAENTKSTISIETENINIVDNSISDSSIDSNKNLYVKNNNISNVEINNQSSSKKLNDPLSNIESTEKMFIIKNDNLKNNPSRPLNINLNSEIERPCTFLNEYASKENSQLSSKSVVIKNDVHKSNPSRPLNIDLNSEIKRPASSTNGFEKAKIYQNVPLPKNNDIKKLSLVSPPKPDTFKAVIRKDIITPNTMSPRDSNTLTNKNLLNNEPLRPSSRKPNTSSSSSEITTNEKNEMTSEYSASRHDISSSKKPLQNTPSLVNILHIHKPPMTKNHLTDLSLKDSSRGECSTVLQKAATFENIMQNNNQIRKSVDSMDNLNQSNNQSQKPYQDIQVLKSSLDAALLKEKSIQDICNQLLKEKEELLYKIDQLEIELKNRIESFEENKKLKVENMSLIRVIARLSRESQ